MPQSPELRYFLKAHYREPDVAPDYQSPACPDAERRFSKILRRGRRAGGGEIFGGVDISQPHKKLAKLYRARVVTTDARKWVTVDTETIPDGLVLVKNPEPVAVDNNFGQTNALLVLDNTLFVGVQREDGFSARRPVRGANPEGLNYDYQTELRGMFLNMVGSVPADLIPSWVRES